MAANAERALLAPPTIAPTTVALSQSPVSGNRCALLLWTLSGASIILGLMYVFAVRPGTPYDEPAHFSLVQYYARFAGMPVLGRAGVSYEGYQAPLYYALSAVLYRLARPAGVEFAFYALRIAGLALLIPAVFLSFHIARRAFPASDVIPIATALFVALNPSILAIAGSIQNDMLAIVLSMGVSYLGTLWLTTPERMPSTERALVLGLLVSAAVMTKLTAAFLALGLPLFVGVVYRRRSPSWAMAFLMTVALCTAWWFARNWILYSDFSGAKAMKYHFPEGTNSPLKLWNPGEVLDLARGIFIYWWLPVEYHRNLVHASSYLRALIGGLTLFSVAGWVGYFWNQRRSGIRSSPKANLVGWFLGMQYGLCLAIYTFNCAAQWCTPGRVTLPTFAVSAMLICAGGAMFFNCFVHLSGQAYLRTLVCTLLIANAYILWTAYLLPVFPFHLFVKA